MELTNNRIYGEYLGYPSCCIEAFGDVAVPMFMRDAFTQKATLNGFVPCPACAKKLLNGEITYHALINPNRKCTVPFKRNTTNAEEVQIHRELEAL